jgi:hypothetical protein
MCATLQDPDWRAVMQLEFDALQANQTWSLMPHPPGVNIISGKWVFKNKLHPDGSLQHHKAQWVVRGFKQWSGIDFNQTFSLVVKPVTIRTILHLVVVSNWPVH